MKSRHQANRREFLKVGVLGTGLTLGHYLRLSAQGAVDPSRGRSGILVFLKGGPSHIDTFDMKPEAPAEYRGAFRPIETAVPGLSICEHLPRLARAAGDYAVIRGLSHNLAAHDLGTRYLLTGNRPTPQARYPSFGAVASHELAAPPDLPPYVAIDRDPEGPGFLGVRHGALSTGAKPSPNEPFRVRGIALGDGLTVSDLDRGRRLLDDLDTAFRGFEELDDHVAGLDDFSRRAHRIIGSRRTREAFDLEREDPRIAARFGRHPFGLSFLLACRLIEAGVRFVTVLVEDWDTHQKNFDELERRLLPPFDEGLAALFSTLREKGLFESTAVLVSGEFGRTPKVNGNAGRDHWPQAMFALMAGGDVRGGQVLGHSDARASEPASASEAFSPDDLAASFYHNIGIDPRREFQTDTRRPITLVRDGRVIRELFRG